MANNTVTAQQAKAIQTQGRPLLVEAGAGTGKTWVLVERFVHLLQTHSSWSLESVVAITFTEKAAREMRGRIRRRVEALAEAAEADSPWHRHRQALDRLQVGTIHGFCAQILRENALVAGLDPTFGVLDEQEAQLLQAEAVRETLRRLTFEERLIGELLSEQRISDLQREMGEILRQRATVRRLFEEMRGLDDAAILERWREGVRVMQAVLWRDELVANPTLQEALDFFLEIDQASLKDDDKMTPWVRLAYQAAKQADTGSSAEDLVETLCGIGDLRGGVQKNWTSKEQLAKIKEHLGLLRDLAKGLAGRGFLDRVGEVDQAALSRLRLWLRVWDVLEATYQQMKRNKGALDFDDLEIETEELLRKVPRPSRLHFFLSEIRHLMVDEFQDTNQSQQRIVYALAQSAQPSEAPPEQAAKMSSKADIADGWKADAVDIADGWKADAVDIADGWKADAVDIADGWKADAVEEAALRTPYTSQAIHTALLTPQSPLFVVGDAKQSIYRFRQAQVSVFQRTASDIASLTGASALSLSQSFRTHGRLVAALNAMFAKIFAPIGEDYEDFEARPSALQAARELPDEHPAAKAPLDIFVVPEKVDEQRLSSEEVRIWEGRWIAKRIQGLVSEGFQVWDKDQRGLRAIRLGDIAILFRATTHLSLYEEELKRAGLAYQTVSGRGYYQRPEVQDMIALLSCLDHPHDDLGLAAVLRSPLFNLSDETLYRLRLRPAMGSTEKGQRRSFYDALFEPPETDQAAEVAMAAETLKGLWGMLGRVQVWEILREALERTGYEATLAMRDRRMGGDGRQFGNLQKLMQIARAKGGADLGAFLRRLRDLQEIEAREGEAIGEVEQSDAIQLMSIHAAKGLEFPVVILADTGRRLAINDIGRQLLHDPAFGLVCKLRDTQMEWIRPSSYLWGEWCSRRMEEAESKRLFYVACTRAADLLIVSGKVGDRHAWMRQVLQIWDIPVEPERSVEAAKDSVNEALVHEKAGVSAPKEIPSEVDIQTIPMLPNGPRAIILPEDEAAFSASPYGPTADMPALRDSAFARANLEASAAMRTTADAPALMETASETTKDGAFLTLSHAFEPVPPAKSWEDEIASAARVENVLREGTGIRVFRLLRPFEAPPLRAIEEREGVRVAEWPALSQALPTRSRLRPLLSVQLVDALRFLGEAADEASQQRLASEFLLMGDDRAGVYREDLSLLWMTEMLDASKEAHLAWVKVWRSRLLRSLLAIPQAWERTQGEIRTHLQRLLHREDALFHVDHIALGEEVEVLWWRDVQPFLQKQWGGSQDVFVREPFFLSLGGGEVASGTLDVLWQEEEGVWSLWCWCLHPTLGSWESAYLRAIALQAEAVALGVGQRPRCAVVCLEADGWAIQTISDATLTATWDSWKKEAAAVSK
ncbi:UvrD-helicase domain-containing protein [Myxococcota bacterium]|nr:UvrD-helicase domain-containing protein [Myxococcota bacterium]